MKNIKSRINNDFKKTAEFFTPHEIGRFLYDWCGFHNNPTDAKIYDPTCGEGDFLLPFYEKGCSVYGQDISQKNIDVCRDFLPEGTFHVGDTLKNPHFQESFDIVLLNPPYLGNECEYIDHAFQTLSPKGKIYALLPGGCLYGNKYQTFRKKYLPHIPAIFQLPKNLFIDSPISVNLVFLYKEEIVRGYTYFYDCSDGFTKSEKVNILDTEKVRNTSFVSASWEDIEKNDFNLSVQSRTQIQDSQAEEVSLEQLQEDIRNNEIEIEEIKTRIASRNL